MRTTLNLKEELVKEAMRVTNSTEKTALIHMALEALIEKAARVELIRLGGKIKSSKLVKRNRRSA